MQHTLFLPTTVTILLILTILTPFPLALSFPFPLNIADSTLSLPSLNASSHIQHDHARCDGSKTQNWQAYAFLVEDCFVAVNQFYLRHVVRNPDEIFEFSSRMGQGYTRYPRVVLPQVFTHGKWLKSHSSFPRSMCICITCPQQRVATVASLELTR